jgi:hypothetical protein
LKNGAKILEPTITELMKVFEGKRVPEQWKIARILPLLKKGNKEKIGNYRPISTQMCSMSKIYERY